MAPHTVVKLPPCCKQTGGGDSKTHCDGAASTSIPFYVAWDNALAANEAFQTITANRFWRNFSFEEIRFRQYLNGESMAKRHISGSDTFSQSKSLPIFGSPAFGSLSFSAATTTSNTPPSERTPVNNKAVLHASTVQASDENSRPGSPTISLNSQSEDTVKQEHPAPITSDADNAVHTACQAYCLGLKAKKAICVFKELCNGPIAPDIVNQQSKQNLQGFCNEIERDVAKMLEPLQNFTTGSDDLEDELEDDDAEKLCLEIAADLETVCKVVLGRTLLYAKSTRAVRKGPRARSFTYNRKLGLDGLQFQLDHLVRLLYRMKSLFTSLKVYSKSLGDVDVVSGIANPLNLVDTVD